MIDLEEQQHPDEFFKQEKTLKYNDQFDDLTGAMTRDNNQSSSCYESTVTSCGSCFGSLRTWLPCCCCMCPYPYVEISQQEEAVVEQFGKFKQVLKPGFHRINPFTENV